MDFVNEEDDLILQLRSLVDDLLDPRFELSSVLRSCDHPSQIKGDDPLVLHRQRHLAFMDPSRESFDDGGLPDSWFSDEARIVLRLAVDH